MDLDFIARFDLVRIYKDFSALCHKPYFAYIEGHASCQVVYRFLMCPVLKDLTEA